MAQNVVHLRRAGIEEDFEVELPDSYELASFQDLSTGQLGVWLVYGGHQRTTLRQLAIRCWHPGQTQHGTKVTELAVPDGCRFLGLCNFPGGVAGGTAYLLFDVTETSSGTAPGAAQ